MKVLIATAKPFAAEAVQGIKKEFEGTGHEVVLLEKYETNEQLLDAVKDVDAMIVRSDKITAAAFHIQGAPGLNGNIPAVRLIHYVFYGNGQIVARVIQGVHIIVDRNKAYPIGRKYPAHIAPCFNVLTSQPGQVLDNDTVGFAFLDKFHHFLKCWPVKKDSAVTVVNLFVHNLNLRVLDDIVINQFSLVRNTVAFR